MRAFSTKDTHAFRSLCQSLLVQIHLRGTIEPCNLGWRNQLYWNGCGQIAYPVLGQHWANALLNPLNVLLGAHNRRHTKRTQATAIGQMQIVGLYKPATRRAILNLVSGAHRLLPYINQIASPNFIATYYTLHTNVSVFGHGLHTEQDFPTPIA